MQLPGDDAHMQVPAGDTPMRYLQLAIRCTADRDRVRTAPGLKSPVLKLNREFNHGA